MAARSENEGTSDGETYIEKYTRGVLQVENILSLERLRQARKRHFLHLLNWIMRIQVSMMVLLKILSIGWVLVWGFLENNRQINIKLSYFCGGSSNCRWQWCSTQNLNWQRPKN